MDELLRTTNVVTLSFVEATLTGEGIDHLVADRHIAAIEGGIGAFPRRVLVPSDQIDRARRIMREEGLGDELTPVR